MLRHLVNLVLAALPPTRLFALRRLLWRLGGLELAHNARICGGGWIYGRGALTLGRDSWFSPGATIFTHPDAPIRIGADCDIGPQTTLVTGSHDPGTASRRAGVGKAAAITIGDGCWIGARSTILGGVTIGDGCVVAAGSVVTRDLPPHVLAAGVPAVVKRALDR